MLMDTRSAAATVTAPPASTLGVMDPRTAAPQATGDLLNAVGVLVSGMGLAEDASWVRASRAVAALAATLRSAVIDLANAARARQRADVISSASVPISAPPVVRAREIGFLCAELAAILRDVDDVEDERRTAVDLLLLAVADRLGAQLHELQEVLHVGASAFPRQRDRIRG